MDILLFGNETNTRWYLTTLLNNIPGVTKVLATSNGKEAIKLVKQHRPDLIVLDIEQTNDDLTGMEIVHQRWCK